MASSSAPVEEQAVEDHTSSVWKCAALGDLEHLQKLLEERPDAVNIADEEVLCLLSLSACGVLHSSQALSPAGAGLCI